MKNDMTTEPFDLRCPRCGSDYLHQGKVTVFERAEDGAVTTVITVPGDSSAHLKSVPSDQILNPSSRRHGLSVEFWCEGCNSKEAGDYIELTLAQHKGNTLMGWRFSPLKN